MEGIRHNEWKLQYYVVRQWRWTQETIVPIHNKTLKHNITFKHIINRIPNGTLFPLCWFLWLCAWLCGAVESQGWHKAHVPCISASKHQEMILLSRVILQRVTASHHNILNIAPACKQIWITGYSQPLWLSYTSQTCTHGFQEIPSLLKSGSQLVG